MRIVVVMILCLFCILLVMPCAFAEPESISQPGATVNTDRENANNAQVPPEQPEQPNTQPSQPSSIEEKSTPQNLPSVAGNTPPNQAPLTKVEPAEKAKPFYWESYVKLLDQYPGLVLVDHYGPFLARPIVFLLMLLIFMRSGRWFLDYLLGPEHNADGRRANTYRILRLTVWVISLAVASECVGMSWFVAVTSPVIRLVATLLSAVVWFVVSAVIVGAIAFAISLPGRDLVLSLLGGLWYLTRAEGKPTEDQDFNLEDNVTGKIVNVDLLTTTFRTDEGDIVYYPNALAMKEHYHWQLPPIGM